MKDIEEVTIRDRVKGKDDAEDMEVNNEERTKLKKEVIDKEYNKEISNTWKND